jgi:2-oxoglutarate/2-oxoacid ferredoxin oxidoreductase subunit beta
MESARFVDTSAPPEAPSRRVAEFQPSLLLGEHSLCPGCGEPVALRLLLEVLQELDIVNRSVGVVGHGCYGSFVRIMDVDVLQCLHGRAPSCATGIKRMRPEAAVFTMQGDGDMVNEGLQEVLHTAARGENVTAILLNNGVFGDTGGQQTATTVLGQRTKNTLAGRDAAAHGYPILLGDLLARLPGVAYAARGAVNTHTNVARTKRMVRDALATQLRGDGFSFVEILTMCPTGWFVDPKEAPEYLGAQLGAVHAFGVLKDSRRTDPGPPPAAADG